MTPQFLQLITDAFPDLPVDWAAVNRSLAQGPPTAIPPSPEKLQWADVAHRLSVWAMTSNDCIWSRGNGSSTLLVKEEFWQLVAKDMPTLKRSWHVLVQSTRVSRYARDLHSRGFGTGSDHRRIGGPRSNVSQLRAMESPKA